MQNSLSLPDTILWTNESDSFTGRVFSKDPDPYHSSKNKAIVQKLNRILTQLKVRPSSILDVGCAAGFKLYQLKKIYPKARLFGVDPGKKSIRLARKNVPGANFKVGFAHDIDHPDQAFDLSLLFMVLQWVPRRHLLRSVSEIDRVTKKYIYISEYLPVSPTFSLSHHNSKVKIFKQNYAKLFESLPWWKIEYFKVRDAKFGEDYRRAEYVLKRIGYKQAYRFRPSVRSSEISRP